MKVENTLFSYIVSQLLLWFSIGIAIFIPHNDGRIGDFTKVPLNIFTKKYIIKISFC
jgi:hypothetical protein